MRAFLFLLVLAAIAAVGFVYSGLYPIGADQPHWPVTERAVAMLRARRDSAAIQ